MKQIAVATLSIIAFFLLLGIAGSSDYTDHIILSMSYETYHEIKDIIGKDASDRDIAEYFVKHRDEFPE